nr:hypothetical protein [Tanacetum cinerariifolium]
MAEGEIDDLTMEQYVTLTQGNQAPGVVKPEIRGNADRLSPRTVDSWDILKKFFIQRSINNNNNNNTEGIAAIVTKLDSFGRDMKKLKKNVHAIQVGCQIYRGAHLDKECPRNEEVKRVEEVKYGEFRRPSPFSIRAKYHVGPPRYYTRIDNCPYFVEKKPSLEELMNKHLKESTKEELRWKSGTVSEVNNSSLDQCKAVYDNKKAPLNNEINEPREVSFFSDNRTLEIQEEGISSKIFSCQLPPKELNPGHFTLPSSIGSLNFYAMADLGASINVIPKSMFEHLKLARLKKTDILVEMAYMTKRAVIGIVENVLIKINKFLFPSDFVVIYMLKIRNKTVILRRPFFATIHAEIDGFNKESSLGIGDDRVTFDMNKKVNNFTTQ